MAQVPAPRGKQAGGLTRGDRQHPLDQFRQQVDQLFDRFFGGWPVPFARDPGEMRVWDFDVKENDKEVVVRAEVPGFEENELQVQMDENVLTIRAEKEQRGEGEQEYRSFSRSFTLPPGINAEAAQASYRNGVLELHLPRVEGAGPKRIPVRGQHAGAGTSPTQPEAGATSGKGPSEAGGGAEQGEAPKAAKA